MATTNPGTADLRARIFDLAQWRKEYLRGDTDVSGALDSLRPESAWRATR